MTRKNKKVRLEQMHIEQMHMHAKYQVSICNGSKVLANVKVVLRQTDGQTDRQPNRQGKNNMPPRSYLGGKKTYMPRSVAIFGPGVII